MIGRALIKFSSKILIKFLAFRTSGKTSCSLKGNISDISLTKVFKAPDQPYASGKSAIDSPRAFNILACAFCLAAV